MQLFDIYLDIIKNHYADFKGRLPRRSYWVFVLFNILISTALYVLSAIVLKTPILCSVYSLAIMLPGIGACIRRLHDIGKSGWWYLLALTGVGAVVLLVFFCLPGDECDNAYGQNPADADSRIKIEKQEPPVQIIGDDEEDTILEQIDDDETTIEDHGSELDEAEPRASLIRLSDNTRIDMRGWSYSLGRNPAKADYVVSDKKTISSKHATIYISNGNYYIADNDSTNGTFVNQVLVPKKQNHVLKEGDIIKLSDEQFVFHIL